jgi:hypothetical protein
MIDCVSLRRDINQRNVPIHHNLTTFLPQENASFSVPAPKTTPSKPP